MKAQLILHFKKNLKNVFVKSNYVLFCTILFSGCIFELLDMGPLDFCYVEGCKIFIWMKGSCIIWTYQLKVFFLSYNVCYKHTIVISDKQMTKRYPKYLYTIFFYFCFKIKILPPIWIFFNFFFQKANISNNLKPIFI